MDKFSTNLKDVLSKSLEAVILAGKKKIEPFYLLQSMSKQRGSISFEILRKVNFKTPAERKNISSESPGSTATKLKNVTPVLSPESKRAIEKAVLAANLFSHKYVGTEHLLFGLLEIQDKNVISELHRQKINVNSLKSLVENILKTTTKFPEIVERDELMRAHEAEAIESGVMDEAIDLAEQERISPRQKQSALDYFSVDLTSPDTQGNIDPLIGREEEADRLMQILCRRHKNNPLLLGDPGVGKTAIVEGLAKKIMLGQVPAELLDKKILALDLSLIIAGTMYRGEFEARLKQIIEEIKTNEDLIIFIDEVHNIVGAGATAGSLDAANILKPALARGELHCIGATTLEEYKKHIESDPALERRFQAIFIKEPTREQTIKILQGIKPNYEKFHHVKIQDQAINTAVDLSMRYLTDKFLPDKAIDLIDEAASGIKLKSPADPNVIQLREYKNELKEISRLKQQAVLEERYPEAVEYKEREKELNEKIFKVRRSLDRTEIDAKFLKEEHVNEILAKQIGASAQEIQLAQNENFKNIKQRVGQFIIGQDHISDQVTKALGRAKMGFNDPNRPLASLLFVGPSGVGKTEYAKTLARLLYPNQDALIQIDMAEFKESFTASKLLGSPAGYIGYKDRNKFTDEVRKKPYAVVLFDEFEKAHPDIQNLLLQILEQGSLSDGTGRKINFKNTIIILTTNLGQELFSKKIGFEAGVKQLPQIDDLKKELEAELKNRFKPEFINRLDNTLYFNPIGKPALEKICGLELEKIHKNAQEMGINIKLEPSLIASLVFKNYDPEHGARSIRKIILDLVENPLAEMVLNGKINKGDNIQVLVKKGCIEFNEIK